MKAIICTKYGPPEVLKLKEVPKPNPRNNEILIKIHATTASTPDVINRSFSIPPYLKPTAKLKLGINKPKNPILGFELSGEIEATGKDVHLFKEGDKVFASTFEFGFGCYAEYVCLAETEKIALMPNNLTYEEAAAVPLGGLTALAFLRYIAKITQEQRVLIYGASSSVGTYAVQLARYYGAEVTGVCSTVNLEIVKSLGADFVIDYTKEDFTNSNKVYDVIFDVVNKLSFSHCKNSLKQQGVYLVTFPSFKFIIQMLWTSITSDKKAKSGEASEKAEDLVFLKGLIEEVKLKPVIDRSYPFEEIVSAHRYVEQGHKKGNVVITVTSYR
jgi:NADPH:quinone reductase-like Zn-dependent oxidoreductase